MPHSLLFELSFIIIFAAIFAFLIRLLKQPLIPAYIIAGILIGPVCLGLVQDKTLVLSLSEIGIAFLLFIVGLEMDIMKLKEVSLFSSLGGLLQVFFVFLLGFFAAILLGFTNIGAVFLGLIVAFSSTVIVVKILSEKREIDTLHGRIILGILLMQDIIAIVALLLLTAVNKFSSMTILITFFKGLFLFVIAWMSTHYILPKLFKFAAKSEELLFLSSLAVCFLFSLLAVISGFSIVIGAFLAGIIIARLPYNLAIISKISPLRDFFSIIFFVSLGIQLVFTRINLVLFGLAVFLVIVLLLKPLVVMILSSVFGYKKEPHF